ncbi:MAG: EamA family transporter [Alphaproteobacteria bacterium]|nr:EamA family transporter [Alphaproteobacteria bacterium]
MVSAAEQRFGSGAWPWALLVIGAFVVSTNHILGRYVGGEIPPMGLAFWRITVGALVLLPFAWRDLLLHRRLILRHWKLFTAMALMFMPLGNATVYLAYNFTTALNGGIIATAQPALTVIFAWLILRHTINAKQGVGIAVAAIGVLMVLMRGDPSALGSLSFSGGDLLLVVGTTSFAVYSVMLRKVPAAIGPMLILVVIQIFGMITLAPLYLYESITYLTVPFTTQSLLVIAWVGTAIAVVAVGLNNLAVLGLGPAKASVGHYMRALFTATLAILVLGETMEWYHFVAVLLVVVGVVLMSRGRTPEKRSDAG